MKETPEELKARTVIVSRHAGLVEWLKTRRGVEGNVIAHATEADIRGKYVFGNLPMHLAAKTASITTVDMPDLPADKRGVDLTPDEMDTYGAKTATYVIWEITDDKRN